MYHLDYPSLTKHRGHFGLRFAQSHGADRNAAGFQNGVVKEVSQKGT